MDAASVPLAGGWIDRDVETRASAELLDAAWNHPDATVLRLNGPMISMVGEGTTRRLSLISASSCDVDPHERVYLGRRDGAPVFASLVPADEDSVTESWEHPFVAALDLTPAERELVVMASALARWHEAAGYSSREGTPTTVADGGWSRRDERGGELFPRTDPAVIVLVEHNNRLLLGSNALWESGRFSLLAGFVEAGETLEQAVAREIFEESGAVVDRIRYVASQPWPFPRSLMLGFRASLADGHDPDNLVPDPQEISELRWFTRDELQNPPAGIRLPAGVSIAAWLIEQWIAEGDQ